MAFGKSISLWLKTKSGTDMHFQQLAQASNTNIVVPATGSFWPGNPRAGYVRIKQATLGTNARVQIGSIVATDGTNIANISAGDVNLSPNNNYIDSSFMFLYDWGVQNISVNCVSKNSSSTFDIEVVGVQ